MCSLRLNLAQQVGRGDRMFFVGGLSDRSSLRFTELSVKI